MSTKPDPLRPASIVLTVDDTAGPTFGPDFVVEASATPMLADDAGAVLVAANAALASVGAREYRSEPERAKAEELADRAADKLEAAGFTVLRAYRARVTDDRTEGE